MYYTLEAIQIDDKKSADPVKYRGRHHEILGKELVGFLRSHIGNHTWLAGATTKFGPHSFLLAKNPTIDDLKYWNLVMKKKYTVKIGCGGALVVVDKKGEPIVFEATVNLRKPDTTMTDKELYGKISKLIKKYFD